MGRQGVRFLAEGVDPPVLEGELWLPDAQGAVAGVVVAHPHPLRGGSMDSNVVVAICQGLQAAGIAWLRFNFRGVDGSEGEHGGGTDEVFDVLGALAFLGEQPQIDAGRVGLAGYSFGARVSLTVAPRAPQARALLLVAPPLREPIPPADAPTCPLRVLVGDRDGNISDGVERYAACLPNPLSVQVVPGTDHFWWGFEPVLVDAAREFFSAQLSAVGGRAS